MHLIGLISIIMHHLSSAPSRQHTTQPIVTGTTVLAVKYAGGVMLAADTLASYGSMARYKDVKRLTKVGENTLMGASGEISDYQSIVEMLDNLHQEDINQDDGYKRTPQEYYHYLRTVMYQRRNKFNPLWNQVLVAGYNAKNNKNKDNTINNENNNNNKAFLGYVDLIGTQYEENYIATGFGAYLAIPLIRERWTPEMTEGEARGLLEDCLRVLYYRDCRASNRIILGKVSEEGVIISEPYTITSDWETANYDVRHSSAVTLDGSSW